MLNVSELNEKPFNEDWANGFRAGQRELAAELERCQDDDAGDKGNLDRINLIIHDIVSNGNTVR